MTLWLMTALLAVGQPSTMAQDWANPPTSARLRAYWWWLNGSVTQASITRDLEEMKAKGFGGALICDADGSGQDGNARVPHGPTFFSPEWRALYRHALREADRLGLEMSLNIQSGWNLGGPMVTRDDAPKKLTWTELGVNAGASPKPLAQPPSRDGYYHDIAVLAWREPDRAPDSLVPRLTASSAQAEHGAELVADGDPGTFWVSNSVQPGGGPTPVRPEWLRVDFERPMPLLKLELTGRFSYGPRSVDVEVSEDGDAFRPLLSFEVNFNGVFETTFQAVPVKALRLVIRRAWDPLHPDRPRNVQVSSLRLTGAAENGPAWQWPSGKPGLVRGLRNLPQKALLRALGTSSAPSSAPLFEEFEAQPGEEDTAADAVLDLTDRMDADGKVDWVPPDGRWTVLRLGYTLNDHCRVSTCSEGWDGYALDPFDAGAFGRYWDAVVEPLIADAGPLAGRTLRYLHTDSWEVEVANWTPTLRTEFRARRGYDLLPWLPVITGHIVGSRAASNAFLHDFRRTMGDLAIANHYQPFRDGAHRHGLLIHPESGGPHAVPIDAQQCLGYDDAPMSEFWSTSPRHRVGDPNRFFVKQPASAAHTYGHRLVLAEGFTNIGLHWQEGLWDNLKPSFDKALCEGLNLLVWHAFVCSPDEQGVPGAQYFAGTHLNPNVTWWSRSAPFFDYINRCQALLQRGRPVADVLYYYGDHVPNFAQLRASDPAQVGPGYDYDVIDLEALLGRVSVRDGRLVLPDGVSYRLLVLPDRPVISLPALRRIGELVQAGAVVLGPKPSAATGLIDSTQSAAELARLASELWDGGKIIAGRTARQVLTERGVAPDVAFEPPADGLDFIHRRDGDDEVYFVANRADQPVTTRVTFRVAGRQPQLWDAVSGERRALAGEEHEGRTTVSLDLPPCGSAFVVFRAAPDALPTVAPTAPPTTLTEVTGAWQVTFDPRWSRLTAPVTFDELVPWPARPEAGIAHYSGTAVYRQRVTLPDPLPAGRLWLDLGRLHELAEVRVNGQPCGIVWAPPFRVDITAAARPGDNAVEVDVVNFWYNRVLGDRDLPAEQRFTRTNIRRLESPDGAPMPAGLLGPVRVLSALVASASSR